MSARHLKEDDPLIVLETAMAYLDRAKAELSQTEARLSPLQVRVLRHISKSPNLSATRRTQVMRTMAGNINHAIARLITLNLIEPWRQESGGGVKHRLLPDGERELEEARKALSSISGRAEAQILRGINV